MLEAVPRDLVDDTVGSMAARAEADGGEAVAAHRPVGGGKWVPETWSALGRLRRGVAVGLLERGVQRGDRVALLSHTRWEWGPIDLGILTIGAVTIGIYPTSTPAQVEYILKHSRARLVFVESEAQRARLSAVLAGLEVVVIDTELAAFLGKTDRRPPVGGDATASPRETEPELTGGRPELEARAREVRGSDLATLVYTSGTTGPPKAVALTHQNLLATSKLGTQYLGARRGDLAVSYLPMAHVLTRVNYYGYLQIRGCAFLAEALEKVNEAWLAGRPVMVAAVPRVLEKVQARILEGVASSRPLRRKLFARALAVGLRVLDLRQEGKPVPAVLQWEHRLWQRLVGKKLRARLGWENVRYVLCGGAPTRLDVLRFFHALGILVLEGFGMTETSSPISLNHPDAYRLGSVGRPLPGIQVKIARDGEILVKSPGMFQAYEGDAAATQAAFDAEGWFQTGDVGRLDADGFLRITDRKKDLIITGGGKNVAPQNIEALVRQDARVSQVVAVGDQRPYLVALVTLQPGADASAAAEAIARANTQLAPYETIKKHVVVAEDFTVENELLTPTLKVKRRAVEAKYAREISALYAGG